MDTLPELLLDKYRPALAPALWPAQTVRCTVTREGVWSFDSDAQLYCGPDGTSWIWMRISPPPPDAIGDLVRLNDLRVKVTGSFSDQRSLDAGVCMVESVNLRGGTGLAVFHPTSGHVEVGLDAPFEVTILLHVVREVSVLTKPIEQGACHKVTYSLLNALFDGLDKTERADGEGRRTVVDKFSWTASGRTWTIRWMEGYEKQVRPGLRSGSMSSAPTATLSVNGVLGADLTRLDADVDSICWLLGFATGCMVTAPLRRVESSGTVIEERLRPETPHNSARSNTSHELITNHEPHEGLKRLLEHSHAPFSNLRDGLGLTDFLGWLGQSRSQRVIQMKVVAVVLAIEALSFKWVTTHGLTESQAAQTNIETKLNRMRKDGMHFIDKRFTSTDLRSDIRNPLMHTGAITVLSFEELMKWGEDLYDLSARLFLFIVGYEGKYRQINNHYKLADAPART